MSDVVMDSCVVAKWVLPEADRDKAFQLMPQAVAAGDRLIAVGLALVEVANVIWKRQRRGLTTRDEAERFLDALLRLPMKLEASAPLVPRALEIAVKYDRSVYDALFLALSQALGIRGVTADEPLFNAARADFPQISHLRLM